MEAIEGYLKLELLWGVVLWRLVVGILLVFLGFASRRVVKAIFRGRLQKFAAETEAQWDDEVIEYVPAPIGAIAQIGLWFGAAWLLQLPTEPVAIRGVVFQGFEIALWASITWLGFRLVDVVAGTMGRIADKTDSKLDDQLIPMLRRTLKLVIGATVAIMVIQNLGYSVTSLVASIGVGGIALAMAAKDTVANVFGSLVIFTDRPFQIGDWVAFGGVEGTVEEVGFRTTQVRRFDKSSVTVPNAIFSSTPIVNHSRRNLRRINMNIGLTYETSAAQLQALLPVLREAVSSHPGIDDGFSFVHLTGFGASSLDLQVYCFTESTVWTDFLATRESLMLKIMEIVGEARLELAFPTQTVYLRDEKWSEKQTVGAI